jgi:acyl-CoA hydrolase
MGSQTPGAPGPGDASGRRAWHPGASIAGGVVHMREISAAEAAALLRTEDTLAVPLGPGQPGEFLHALGSREDWRALTVFAALLLDFYPLFTRPGVRLLSGFFGPVERALRAAGHDVSFIPADFRRFARIARELAPRVMATAAALPDAGGRLSLSLHAGATVDELRRCGRDPDRLLVVEVSPHLPHTLGLPPEHRHALEVDDVDVLVQSERPPPALPESSAGPVEHAIAEHAHAYIGPGTTLQTGIGAVPNEIVKLLAEGPGGDYGIHSEMFTTGLMRLHRAGKVSNALKGVFEGISVTTFALGSEELYAWLDGNPEVRFLPVAVVNDPSVISRNRNMLSINGALAVDLAGQVAADTLEGRQYSGIGGHEDFVSGAGLAEGDRSLVCLPASARVEGRRVSRIVRHLAPGTLVTTPRHQVDVVITEFGSAELAGRSVEERARALAEIADPEFRAELLG